MRVPDWPYTSLSDLADVIREILDGGQPEALVDEAWLTDLQPTGEAADAIAHQLAEAHGFVARRAEEEPRDFAFRYREG